MPGQTGLLSGLVRLLRRPGWRRVRFGLLLGGGLCVASAGLAAGGDDDGPVGTARRVERLSAAIDRGGVEVYGDLRHPRQPVSVQDLEKGECWRDEGLSDVMARGLRTSGILRDIGGVVLRSPDAAMSTVNRQLQQVDPRFGREAALSAFDAQLSATANFNRNDRLYNNSFYAGGTNSFLQDFHDYRMELSKRTVAGSQVAVRSLADFDSNNAPANTFRSGWNTAVEGEVRQSLLQGSGVEFNRIAGPLSQPGSYNGILIARVNGDMTNADFQASLRDYVSNVENGYWDLYAAWRNYDALRKSHAAVAQLYHEKYELVRQAEQQRGGPSSINAVDEAWVRQQVLQLRNEVQEALYGRLLNGTEVRNGSAGGTLQSGGGVLAAERRLRLLTGLPAADGNVIRPADEPTMAEFLFSWDMTTEEALQRRPELQRQNLAVKKRELELVAARNYLKPQLDAVGRYRVRGFGDTFAGGGTATGGAPDTSLGNLGTGDHQEWAVGLEFSVPLGFRKAHAAVSHAELNLMRERTVQREQQREVLSSLSGAWTDRERTWQALQDSLDQYLAARRYYEAIDARDDSTDDRRIDAVRRMYAAESQFFRARAEYAIALKNLHFEKGSLLEYKDMRVHEPSEAEQSSENAQAVPGAAGAAGGPAGAAPAAAEVAAEESEAAVPEPRGAEVAGGRVVLPQSAAKSSARSASAVAVGSDLPEAAPVQRRPAFWRAAKPQPGQVAQPQAATGRARL